MVVFWKVSMKSVQNAVQKLKIMVLELSDSLGGHLLGVQNDRKSLKNDMLLM